MPTIKPQVIDDPTRVRIAEGQSPIPVTLPDEPIEVKLPAPPAPKTVTNAEGKTTLSPTTTEAQDKVSAGQRRINVMWELTQAAIALIISCATVFVMARASLSPGELGQNQMLLIGQLNVMTTLILTSYFTRTNHSRIGGTGAKPDEPYTGR